MKKTKPVLILCLFLICALITKGYTKNLPDLALESFERLFSSSFFREVFDLDTEEAVAVFGESSKAEFV